MAEDSPQDIVLLERRPDGVALLTLNRPKMNALSAALLDWLGDRIRELTEDPPGALVLWGGPRIFAAGADVAEFNDEGGPERAAAQFHLVTGALAGLPRATVAAVNGYALGGGLELALACDLRVVAEDARLGQPEILLGIIPGGGATQRLPRLVGPSRAKDLMLTGRQVGAEEALRMGLADRVVPPDQVLASALELAGSLARGPLLAQAMVKRAVDRGLDGDLEIGLGLERTEFVQVFHTEDAKAGIASFLDQGPGKATFTGR